MSIVIAYDENEERIPITEYQDEMKGKLKCAEGHILIAKRGMKQVHHYAHKSGDIDHSCAREKGEWHTQQQLRIKPDYLEIRFHGDDGKLHIADVVNKNGIVVEYQNSIVDASVLNERDEFYPRYAKGLVWVFNMETASMNIIDQENELVVVTLTGNSYWKAAKRQKFLDFGTGNLLEVVKQGTSHHLCRIWTIKEFDDAFLPGITIDGADRRVRRPRLEYDPDIDCDEKTYQRLERKVR